MADVLSPLTNPPQINLPKLQNTQSGYTQGGQQVANAFGSVAHTLGSLFKPPAPMQGPQQSYGAPLAGYQSPFNLFPGLKVGTPSQTPPAVTPTSTGGVAIHPSVVAAYKAPATPAQTTPAAQQTSAAGSLASYLSTPNQTSGGGTLTTDGNGTPTGYSGAPKFSIDTSGTVPSSMLGTPTSMSDLNNQHQSYQDYINAVSQAQGYSPGYLQALQAQYGAQTQGQQLNLNSAALNSNLYTGNNLPGDTMSYAQGATAKAQAQNTLAQAQNSIQQLGANQALNTQQLARTGAISAAQTQLQYSPEAMASQNAISQYNSLQQQYPNASIPAYNNSLSPALNQQIAQEMVANSPAYKAQFQSTYQTPGGGTGIYNKLDTGGITKNQDGTLSLVSDAAAALGSANAGALNTQVQNYNTVQTSFNTANKTLGTMIQFMQQNGINNNSTPILNQLENKVKAGVLAPGVVAAYQADIAELDTNYATILSRGGSVAGTNEAASSLINPNLKPADLQKVLGELTQNGKNALDATGGQISQLTSQLGGQNSGYSSQSNSSGGLYDF